MRRWEPAPWEQDLDVTFNERRWHVVGWAVVIGFVVLLCLAGGGPS